MPVRTPSSVGLDDLRAFTLTRSPIHFEDGDMRRDYGWTRAFLTAAALVGVFAFSLRLVLTGLFVTFVTSDLVFVALFNVSVTVLVGGWLLEGESHPATVLHSVVRRRRDRGLRTTIRCRRWNWSSSTDDRL